MSHPFVHSVDPAAAWRSALTARIPPDENALALLTVDLDLQLRLNPAAGLALTERRLLSVDASGEVCEWLLSPELSLRQHDHAGVGSLELMGPHARLGLWRFTLGQGAQARTFLQTFEQVQARLAGALAPTAEAVTPCPRCGGPLPADGSDADDCPACST